MGSCQLMIRAGECAGPVFNWRGDTVFLLCSNTHPTWYWHMSVSTVHWLVIRWSATIAIVVSNFFRLSTYLFRPMPKRETTLASVFVTTCTMTLTLLKRSEWNSVIRCRGTRRTSDPSESWGPLGHVWLLLSPQIVPIVPIVPDDWGN